MQKFIIRIYGLVMNNKNEILISDEFVQTTHISKFPGGGLKFGEGPHDCLRREFKEECNGQEIKNLYHFYTTDFFQKAWFFENAQLLSIYYIAELKMPLQFKTSDTPFDFELVDGFGQSFRWVKIKDLKEDDLTLPIDKFVVNKLKQTFDE
ncbi:NUDIX domain-containing protein [Prolixibacteraceae bacterium Z1-6]|uniref:NUDIX domain-containing protein n=1 Tax=Draconibacterium aestuarii TaxID=2998507 RepID=A0A9X3F388_9BACT|nr:NUDIX domain-containing protein [Prolixibacteraceae bacterium Z1-6]